MGNAEAAYVRIAGILRERILSGEYSPGQQLQTEMQLCRELDVSRITIRQALKILEDETLISRRRGSGTYVRPNLRRKIPLFYADYSRTVAQHAPDLRRRVLEWSWVEADDFMAESMQIQKGEELCRVVRVDDVQEQAVAFDEVWILAGHAHKLSKHDFERQDYLERWMEVEGLDVLDFEQRIEAVRASEMVQKHIGVEKGAPVLKETCDYFLANSECISRIVSYYSPDIFQMGVRVRLHRNVGKKARSKRE